MPESNTECKGCGTIGPYWLQPVCPICGHDNSDDQEEDERAEDERAREM
jgi:rRNA maturation endonuclease Nob1